ncbi:hypothetical protein CEP54_011041 [Fusarium duplospermum]|uniref:N-acetyltransferase domain-containing protein n=1 Tax=Fusarium duplospermum TaxID=1325734 RepID=A0A428PGL6_9HYPO|nr:hypothetical protein CEP54_011041 [Fusarium duplospermum]
MDPPLATSFTIRQATTSDDLTSVVNCFRAYTEWLNMDLAFQDFATELSTLPGKYAPPKAALLLASDIEKDQVLGCIALRPIELQPTYKVGREPNRRYCELKRLYVYPAARGRKVARALVTSALQIAQREGYDEVLLDTVELMTSAIKLYRSMGFQEVKPYYNNPGDGFINMSKDLKSLDPQAHF